MPESVGEPRRMGIPEPTRVESLNIRHATGNRNRVSPFRRVREWMIRNKGTSAFIGATAVAGSLIFHDPISQAAVNTVDVAKNAVDSAKDIIAPTDIGEPWPGTSLEGPNGEQTSYVYEIFLSPSGVNQDEPIIFRNSLDTTTNDNILSEKKLNAIGLVSVDGKPIKAYGKPKKGPSYQSKLQTGRDDKSGKGMWIEVTDKMGRPLEINGKTIEVYTSGNFATVNEQSRSLPVILP